MPYVDCPFFILSTGFGLKPDIPREQALKLCNRINDGMVMVRACVPASDDDQFIRFDHFTVTEGGIAGEEIVALTRRFVKVIWDGFRAHDTDDIVG